MTINDLRKYLSLNMKKHRQKLGLTQENLAEKTELSIQTINGIEGCRCWLSDKSLIKIAEVLNTTPAELLLPPSEASTPDFSPTFIALSELKIELKEEIEHLIDDKIRKLEN